MEVADIDELVESAGDIDPNTVDKDIDDVIWYFINLEMYFLSFGGMYVRTWTQTHSR
jgi:hypothetical protein